MRRKLSMMGLSVVMMCSLLAPSVVSASELSAKQTIVQEMKKEVIQKKAKQAEEPDYINKPEINIYQVPDLETSVKYLLVGGLNYYNGNYKAKVPDGMVKLTMKDSGILMLVAVTMDNKMTSLNLYDANKRKIGSVDENAYFPNVNKGDVYYISLPKGNQESLITSLLFQDHVSVLKNDSSLIQTGTGAKEYRTFTVTKRSKVEIGVAEGDLGKIGGTFTLQKLENGTWKNVDKSKKAKTSSEDFSMSFTYGLTKGSYRFVNTLPKGTVYTMKFSRETKNKKYKTSMKHAQKVKSNRTINDIFTKNEKKSRWYRINRTSVSKKNQYIDVTASMVRGKMKVSFYKKGRKKPLKTKVLKGGTSLSYVSFKPKQGVGTYYVKVQKIGKNTNGSYDVVNETK